MSVKRIDPVGCGCTDCLTGYSKPLDRATDDQVRAMFSGKLIDATSNTFEVTVTREYKDGEFGPKTTTVSFSPGSARQWTWAGRPSPT